MYNGQMCNMNDGENITLQKIRTSASVLAGLQLQYLA